MLNRYTVDGRGYTEPKPANVIDSTPFSFTVVALSVRSEVFPWEYAKVESSNVT